MTSIVCVKTGTKYPSEYANKLAKSLNKHGYQTRIYCITDNSEGIDKNYVIPVEIPNPDYSWWDKLYVYSWEHGINDSLLYLDLDMVPVGDITCFLDWGSYITGSRFDDPKFINSTLISIPRNHGHYIWYSYNENREKVKDKFKWDSKYLDNIIPHPVTRWDNLFPNALVSYKFHVMKQGLKPENRIVSFHGKPDPHEVKDEFVQLHWN